MFPRPDDFVRVLFDFRLCCPYSGETSTVPGVSLRERFGDLTIYSTSLFHTYFCNTRSHTMYILPSATPWAHRHFTHVITTRAIRLAHVIVHEPRPVSMGELHAWYRLGLYSHRRAHFAFTSRQMCIGQFPLKKRTSISVAPLLIA